MSTGDRRGADGRRGREAGLAATGGRAGRVRIAQATTARLRTLPKGDAPPSRGSPGSRPRSGRASWIPLCHPLPLTVVEVELAVDDDGVVIEARPRRPHETGVEMEALTAVTVAALTVYDMAKAVDKEMRDRRGRAGLENEGARVTALAAPLPVKLARLVRIEHTVFALPFAYVGALLAVDGWPGLGTMGWITLAMVGARTLAMSLNRLVDADLDARNPRTAGRELPAGSLTRTHVAGRLRLSPGRLSGRRACSSSRSSAGCGRFPSRCSSPIRTSSASRGAATCGSAPASASRLSARGSRSRATCPGRPGCSAAPCASGSPASTSSTRCSTVSTILQVGLHSWATRFGVRGVSPGLERCTLGRSSCSRPPAPGWTSGPWYWLGVGVVAALLLYEQRSSGRTTCGGSMRPSSRSTGCSRSRSWPSSRSTRCSDPPRHTSGTIPARMRHTSPIA